MTDEQFEELKDKLVEDLEGLAQHVKRLTRVQIRDFIFGKYFCKCERFRDDKVNAFTIYISIDPNMEIDEMKQLKALLEEPCKCADCTS